MDNQPIVIDAEHEGMRVDKYISDAFTELTRSFAQKLIEKGQVTVNSKPIKANHKLKIGEELSVIIPTPTALEVQAQDIAIEVIYEDEQLLVVNKPQGMVVHPAAGNYDKTLVNALLHHCGDSLSGINGVMRPGIIHRIDKDTSGLLLVAKTNEAHLGLSEQIKEHSLTREYITLVNGNVKNDSGIINAPVGRNPNDRKKMCITQKGKEAVTNYYVLERFGGYTLVRCRLKTGRTHQIRVHMSYIGHSVVGDKVYGIKKERFSLNGQLLHAACVGFIHPKTAEYMEFHSPLPPYFEHVLKILQENLKKE